MTNSVIFFTENAEANSKLIKLFEDIADVSVCSYNSQTWDDVDLYRSAQLRWRLGVGVNHKSFNYSISISPDITWHQRLGCDKKYMNFGKLFEEQFVNQGSKANRSIEQSLDLGWRLLSHLPKSELDRVDDTVLNAHYIENIEEYEAANSEEK